jgi:hypothetical protein
MNAHWDKPRMEVLTRLWISGETARIIAEKLGGGVTRNAVIGKAHRLGLTGKHGSKRLKRARALRPEGKRKPKNRAH